MNSKLLLLLIFPLILLIGKYITKIIIYFLAKKNAERLNVIHFKEDIYLYIGTFVLYWITFNLYDYVNPPNNNWLQLCLTVTIAAVPLTYAYLVHPIYYLIHFPQFEGANKTFAHLKGAETIHFRIYESKHINAYATGVLPFTEIILLCKLMIEKFSETELHGVILHEIGHIKKKHLLKSYGFNLIFLMFSVGGFTKLLPLFQQTTFTGLCVAIYFGLMTGINLVFIGSIQKKYELEADSFAASHIGKEHYKKMLQRLNEESGGQMEQCTFNYPTLKTRLANVDSL